MTDINTITTLITPIAKQYGLKRVYLFGSYAKGKQKDTSDVDLLIEKGIPLSLLKLSGFRQDIMNALGMNVDVVTTTGIEKEFQREIEGSEVLIYEA